MTSTEPSFDPERLAALYEPHGPRAEGLARALGAIHGLAIQGMLSTEERKNALESLRSALPAPAKGPALPPEVESAMAAIEREDAVIQEKGSGALSKGLTVLDSMLAKQGVEAHERSEIARAAAKLCADWLPEHAQPRWKAHFEKVALFLDGTGHQSAPGAPAARP